jgi:O-antigen/teichoic acid export membrane protein
MSRTSRFLGGLWIGVISQAVMTLVGLWLTRFTLHRIGASDYGLWLVGLQVATYLGLMDLGVVALLPRETAYAAGREAEGEQGAVAALLARVTRLVVWQWPLAVMAAVAAWALAAAHWHGVGPVLALLLAATMLLFPLRVFAAALTGLQDLAFIGRTQLASWLVGAAVTVALLLAGFGLWAVAGGWVVGQALSPAVFFLRLRRRHREQVPGRLPPIPWAVARQYFGKSLWVSLSQITVQIVFGADVLVVGAVLGPRAVVAYTCTAKLAMVAGNLPLMLPQIAAPALSELRMREAGARLRDVTTALTQAILLGSGLIALVIIVANEGFVGWWVGSAQFGGQALSLLVVALMLLHHYSTALIYSVFSFGHERAVALIGAAQAAVALAAMVLLVPRLGLVGAPLGGIAGELLVAIPLSLRVLTRQVGSGVGGLLGPLRPWALRAAFLVAAAVATLQWWRARSLVSFVAATLVATAAYGLLMRAQLRREPLAPYVERAVGRLPRNLARLLFGRHAG